jgi:hypothetical protein
MVNTIFDEMISKQGQIQAFFKKAVFNDVWFQKGKGGVYS